jgi:hypothetical protein
MTDDELEGRQQDLERELMEVRFWRLVNRRGENDCWPWLGFVEVHGYGQFMRNIKAHRFAWSYAYGQPVPEGKAICHTCDNPPCVNPAHLYSGSMKENSEDMVSRDRSARAKLTQAEVKTIRAEVASGGRGTQARLARSYGLHPMTINRIVKMRTHRKEVMP